jgi:ubiquinone/menaquinone biosynthesis C-methylase UbiE
MLGKETKYWNEVARRRQRWLTRYPTYELLAEHKRKTYIGLIARWVEVTNNQKILKTDLFPEASGLAQVLFDIAPDNGNVIGIDISAETVEQAKIQASRHGVDSSKYLCCDVRQLPLQDSSIDLVISDSTLDHFPTEADIIVALKELYRVMRFGGTLILTMDNKGKLGEPLRSLWIRLGLAPFFIGKTYSIKELKSALQSIGFDVEDTTAIIHQPMFFLKRIVRLLHRLSARRFDPLIKKILASQDNFEKRRTKYLTGLYIAAKAVKRGAS